MSNHHVHLNAKEEVSNQEKVPRRSAAAAAPFHGQRPNENVSNHHVQLNNFVVHVVHATARHLRNSSSFRVIEETAS